MIAKRYSTLLVAATISACFLPALLLLYEVFTVVGANPVENMLHTSGDWVLNFLLLTLTITPLRTILTLPIPWLTIRRTLGLAAFCYALFHICVYVVFDQALDVMAVLRDIPQRRFILVGFLALLILIPLAVTSTNGWQRRLKRKWLLLHKGVYIATALGILHYFWLVKADYTQPLTYGLLFVLLMLCRLQAVRLFLGRIIR